MLWYQVSVVRQHRLFKNCGTFNLRPQVGHWVLVHHICVQLPHDKAENPYSILVLNSRNPMLFYTFGSMEHKTL